MLGMTTHVIAAGRAVNDRMADIVAGETLAALGSSGKSKRILVLGLTFKENIPDTRNSQSHAVVEALKKAGCDVCADDPHVAEDQWDRMPCPRGTIASGPFDAVILLVKHKEFLTIGTQAYIDATKKDGGVIYDLKSVLDRKAVEAAGRKYLAL